MTSPRAARNPLSTSVTTVNEDGSVTNVLGTMQQWFGDVIRNPRQQQLGAARRVEGKVRLGVGNVEHAIAMSSRRAGRSANLKRPQTSFINRSAKLKRAWGLAQEALVG